MKVYQDLNPRGLASNEYGGLTFRLMVKLDENLPDDQLRHAIYNEATGQHIAPKYYSWKDNSNKLIPVNFKLMSKQAKEAGINFVVNNCMSLENSNTTPEFFARVTGIIADLLEQDGWTKENSAIALFNEPGKYLGHGTEGAKKYVEYVKRTNDFVKGRYNLWLINDEYHLLDEEYVFTHTTDIPGRIFCPHHLSSLGKTPAWKHVEYAATQAASWGVPVGCSEGGAWFHPYRSETGHAINVKLLEECAKFNYDFCAIVCVQNNEWTVANTWGTLGYLIYNNDYSVLAEGTEYWDRFIKVLKQYKEEIPIMEYDIPKMIADFADKHGLPKKPNYNFELPILTAMFFQNNNDYHQPGQPMTKKDFDAFLEGFLNWLVKMNPKELSVWYDEAGVYRSKSSREAITKSNPK